MNRRLGKYEILEEIGRGGFATVYRARDPGLDREVAVKVLDPLLMRDPSLVERFRREARASARLRHPNIVRIYDISDAEGMLAIVMELLPGPSLAGVIEREAPLPVERAVELLRPLAEALDYAHAQGLVHRDVKPSNVLLDEQGRPMLTDFGLVKAAEESSSSAVSLTLSQTGMTLGTPAYMAPEQADPKPGAPVDHRADLYSLGVIAYEMLAGGVPFQGNTPMAVAMGHLLEPPPPPRERNPAIPAATEAALLKALEKKPEARFQNAAALVRALEVGASPAPVRAAPPERASRDEPAPRKEPPQAVVQGPAPERVHAVPARAEAGLGPARRSWLMPALVGGVAIVAIILGVLWTSGVLSGDEPTPTSVPLDVSATATATATSELSATEDMDLSPLPTVTATPEATSAGPTATLAPTFTPTPTSTPNELVRDADGMEMVYVPAGAFEMGSNEGSDNEQPVHVVTLDGYWIDRTEVTNAQYQVFVSATGHRAPTRCDWGEPTYNDGNKADHPVVCVSWEDAAAYCEWAGGRLPTEAEWEYAARGPEGREYPWGNEFDCAKGNFDDETTFDEYVVPGGAGCDGYERTAPVGSFPSGESWIGALDLSGNVWEWVGDWYGAYPGAEQENPTGPATGGYRVLRGGSWLDIPYTLRGADRNSGRPDVTYGIVGFRCARGSQ